MKIKDLAAQQIKHELVHPAKGATGIFVELVGPSDKVVRAKMIKAQEAASSGSVPSDEMVIDTIASALRGWDVAAFECDFAPETAVNILSIDANEWIVRDLMKVLADGQRFFR